MSLYPWVVVTHVFLVIVSFAAHGVSAFAMFRTKAEQDRARISAVLDLSTLALTAAGITLVLALLAGIIAAIMGGHFSRGWPWAAIIVVAAIWVLMTPLAATRMDHVRKALGMPSRQTKKGELPQAGSDADLATAQAALQPGLVATLGVGAIAILTWLMEVKPF